MSREEKTRVEVAVDVLDTEAIYAGAVVNTLRVIRGAAENSQSEIGEDIGGTPAGFWSRLCTCTSIL